MTFFGKKLNNHIALFKILNIYMRCDSVTDFFVTGS